MRRLVFVALSTLTLALVGCKSEPYCLNCKDSGNGVIAPADLAPGPDMTGIGTVDLATGPDMSNLNGTCVPTNGGVEICDGIDNDCDGVIDDVPPAKLATDPNNCGKCGNECSYPNAFGVCGGTPPACSIGACQPGHIDLDGNPANGCEYVCTPSNNGVEICDGKDNNCDGQVDEGFTKSWSDSAHQSPLYDSDIDNCGQCAVVCSLGAGTIMSCDADATNGGRGKCDVKACFNGNDSSGTHQTYRHNPAAGSIAVTGCEYHCPIAATQTGTDCNPTGACTFPKETCNGIDDDCDFVADDNLTDAGLGGRCPDGSPGKLCSDSPSPGNCQGQCSAGMLACVNGGLQCQGSAGPSPETCDGKDNDCDGKIDNGFTSTWASNGAPHYDSDAKNCGGCGDVCALPNATNGCQLLSGAAAGTCKVVSCNAGWYFVTHKDSSSTSPTCNVTISGSENSTTTTTGLGCNYQCASSPVSPEICDGKDNDCDGCIDNGLTGPSLCSNKGVCAGQPLQTKCVGAAGYKCDYSGVPNISLDGNGNLATTELQCDNLDNNCNGPCDENFTGVAVTGTGCTNPRAATTCKAGNGVCQTSGPVTCQKSVATLAYNDEQACSATADNTKASNELCNGKDDDCNGLIDEPTTATVGTTTYQGWHDPTVQVAVGDDPVTGQLAHTVYVYAYEASRPDATGVSPGSLSTRACANAGTLPWSNVTAAQAANACAGIKDKSGNSIGRLCTAWEWTQTCNANATSGTHYSMSASNTTYASGICNDAQETQQRCSADSQCLASKCDYTTTPPTCPTSGCTSSVCTCASDSDCNAGFSCAAGVCTGSGAWPTGVAGTSSGTTNFCYSTVGGSQSHDLSGNLMEWTSTPVVLKSGTAATIAAGPSSGQLTISGLTNMYTSDAGAQLVITGATNAADNGTFTIVSVPSASSAVISDASGVAQASGTVSWSVIYLKLRGGAYSTQTSGSSQGLSCEFDFDIQKASFANTDVGFRCCADTQP